MMTCTKILMIDCIMFVCEFIDLDSCLVGPGGTQNSFYVLLQTISQMVRIDPTTLKILIDWRVNISGKSILVQGLAFVTTTI